MHFKRLLINLVIISLVLSALLAIGIFVLGNFGEVEGRILGTTVMIAGFSLTGLCSAVLYERKHYQALAAFGMGIALIGFVILTLLIWEVWRFEDLWRAALSIILLSASCAHAALILLMEPHDRRIRWAQWATVAAIWSLALLVLYPLIVEIEFSAEWYVRLIGVVAVLDALGTLVTPILYKVQHPRV